MKYIPLNELQVYIKSMELGETIWAIASKWNFFAKDTIGKQIVRSTDSIAANIAEGYGRFHYKDKKRFFYFSRASILETKTWIVKAHQRALISKDQFKKLMDDLEENHFLLNKYIKSTGGIHQ